MKPWIPRRYLSRHPERGERQCGHQRITLELQDWFVPALYQASHDSALLKKLPSPLTQLPEGKGGKALHNLPKLQDAGFFGRSRELWQIERAFVQGVRRITITGFGGQGKTYLAIEAGLWLQQTGMFSKVCFVDYAAFQGVDAVGMAVSTLATVLNESLIDENAAAKALQKTTTLLILDNLEALSASALTALLTAAQAWSEAGKSRLLLTTRQNNLAHAAFPKENSTQHLYSPLLGLGQEDALAYFQTLQKLPPEPQFKQPERDALLTLFGMVDFHPLSIGLLAQELKSRRPADLGMRLEALLKVIPANSDNKSLLASLRLSLDRLESQAYTLLSRLGVFQGGAMEDVLLGITEINKTDWAMLRPALESTGLIQAENLSHLDVTVPPYLKFHPTLAPVLWQELNPTQQTELVARYRHSYFQLSRDIYYQDTNNPKAIRIIAKRELPNLLSAVYAALQAGEDFVVEFANNLNWFLNLFGLQRDKAALNRTIQQASGDFGSDSWFLAQSHQGEALFHAGHYAQAESIFQTLLQQLGQTPSPDLCITLSRLGRCFRFQGETADAINCYEKALAVAQQLENSRQQQRQISILHTDLADALTDNGDYAQAKIHYQQALVIVKEIVDTRQEVVVQGQLGTLAMLQGDLQEAKQRHQTALNMFQSLDEPDMEAIAWHHLGSVYLAEKNWSLAEQAYRESARISETHDNVVTLAMTWNNLAIVSNAQGKPDVAESWYRKAIAVKRLGNPKELANSLNNLADLLQNQPHRLNEARALTEEALAIRQTLDATSAEIWNTYELLAQITDKQQQSEQATHYRQLSRDSYLRFAGMTYQMRKHALLIAFVLVALEDAEQRVNLETQLQSPESRQNLVNAIQHIINGERNEAALLEPLDYTDAAIIHLILQGIKNPDSLAILINS